jgi:general secretion pathway protein C
VFWVLRISAPADALAPPVATTRLVASADPAAVARLLGAVPKTNTVAATPEAASRFALWGVIAYGTSRGAALISVDGKPPRPWRVGAQLGEGYVLQSVGLRAATLGASVDSAPAFTLQLPVRAPINLNRPASAQSPGSVLSVGPSIPFMTPLPPVMAPPPGAAPTPAP